MNFFYSKYKNSNFLNLLLEIFSRNSFLISFLILSLWYVLNNIYSWEVVNWDPGSENMVRNAIIYYKESGYDLGGLYHLPPLSQENESEIPKTYMSQFGLQYFLFRGLVFESNFDISFQLIRSVISICTAALFALYVRFLKYEFGCFVAIGTLFLIIGSRWVTLYSGNVYWMGFLFFLPFVLATVAYNFFKARQKISFFYALLSLSIAIKSLCGYEWLTNIVLSGLIPIIYFEIRDGGSRLLIIKRVGLAFLFCCFGFLIALTLHLIKGFYYAGDLSDLNHILGRSAMRMYGEEGFRHINDWRPGWSIAHVVYEAIQTYFFNEYVRILPLLTQARLLILVGFLLCFHKIVEQKKVFLNCLFVLSISFLFSISWGVFAFNHAVTHAGMELILFYLPFNLVAFPYSLFAIKRIYNVIYLDGLKI